MPSIATTLKKLAPLASLGLLAALGTTACVGEAYVDPAYYPSDAFIATEEPVYYQGQPTYYFRGVWFYHIGNTWGYYRSEPAYLRQYRGAHPALGARGGGRGRGGARGGGHGGRR